jgi:FdhD protein
MSTTRKEGIQPTTYVLQKGDRTTPVEGAIIEETLACIFINGEELATFMCTPHKLDELALGFLRSEGIITGLADIELLTISEGRSCVDIWLKDLSYRPPGRPIITSGCGGGITFDDLSQRHPPLNTGFSLQAEQIEPLMKKLHLAAELYNEVRGVHTSALSDGRELLLVAQDVGRHNTIDRLWGQALKQEMKTEGRIILASGRISSEMINKAAKMRVPVIISRTSPTSLSVELGRAWNITVIGYARGNTCRIYTTPERIVDGARLPGVEALSQDGS